MGVTINKKTKSIADFKRDIETTDDFDNRLNVGQSSTDWVNTDAHGGCNILIVKRLSLNTTLPA